MEQNRDAEADEQLLAVVGVALVEATAFVQQQALHGAPAFGLGTSTYRGAGSPSRAALRQRLQ